MSGSASAALFPLLLLASPLLHRAAAAQNERYELGLRVKTMEQAFEARRDDAAARRRALPALQKAVASFFALRLGEAGRALDQAGHELRGTPAGEAEQWAEALVFRPELRLLDAGTRTLQVRIEPLYRVEVEPPAAVELRVLTAAGALLGRASLASLPTDATLTLPVPAPVDGELALRFVVMAGERTLAERHALLAVVPDLEARLHALTAGAAALAPERPALDQATLAGHLETLQALRAGKPFEADVRAAALLAQAEDLLRALTAGRSYLADRVVAGGTFAVRVPIARAAVPVVVDVPPVAPEVPRKLPLVIALHGAGGSENLFVEGYGNGLALRLARARGWLLASPRNLSANAVPRLIDQLATLWPVDRERVFLVGHSMGAMTAVAAASAAPARFRGVAALGGGGAVRDSDGLDRLPFFVAAGSADFGKGGAQGLLRALRKAGVADLRWQEYPDVEHLAIVQAALPDVFRFFDQCAAGAASAPAPRSEGR